MKRERIERGVVAALLVALAVYSVWQRWSVLSASPFPIGVDGYYYPIQLRALLEDGSLHYPSSPLTFWFMLPFAAATDEIIGAKLAAAIGGALVAFPAYAVGARFGRSIGAGLVAAALATTSATSAYLTLEFIKQGIGLTVAVTALWLLLRALDVPSRPRVVAAFAGLVAALLAHKLAAGVVMLVAIPAVVNEARGRAVLRGRRLLYLLAALVLLSITALVLGLVFPQRFLSPNDAALVANLFTSDARWSAPALATSRLRLTFDHEAVVGALVAIAAAAALVTWKPKPHKHGERAAAWTIVIVGIGVGLPWLDVSSPQGLGFRVRIAAFVPLALCASIVVTAAASRIRQLGARERDIAIAVLAVLLALRPHDDRREGMVLAHPALVSAVIASAPHIPAGKTAIVPERHILFMVAWYTRAKVSLRPEPVPHAERARIMNLAFIGMGSPLDEALDRARVTPGVVPPIGVHPRHRNGLVIVTEQTWEWLVEQLPPRAKAHWGRWPTI